MQKLNWKPETSLSKAGKRIVKLLTTQGCQAFFVGGVVRDYLLKRSSDNLDIATDCLPENVQKTLERAGIRYKIIGKKYGTILAIVDKELVEITTFRRESRYSDQRHPDQVEFIREYLEDARRRDLTINALYFDPMSQQLFDPVNGMKDLESKLIRFVGDPKIRIDEDPLRMIRAVRLATTLGFKLEKNSFAAIKTRAKLTQSVSGERIKSELDKILLSNQRTQGLRLMDNIGLLKFVLPELSDQKNIFHNSKRYHLEGNGFEHALLVTEALKNPSLELIYAALLHDSGKIATGAKKLKKGEWVISYHGHNLVSKKLFEKAAARLRFPKQSKDLTSWLIHEHDHKNEYLKSSPEKQVKRALNPGFAQLLDLWQADIEGNISNNQNEEYNKPRWGAYEQGHKYLQALHSKKNILENFSSGKFIIRTARLKPGPQIGQLSDKIKIKIILGEIKNEDDARNFLQKFAKKT